MKQYLTIIVLTVLVGIAATASADFLSRNQDATTNQHDFDSNENFETIDPEMNKFAVGVKETTSNSYNNHDESLISIDDATLFLVGDYGAKVKQEIDGEVQVSMEINRFRDPNGNDRIQISMLHGNSNCLSKTDFSAYGSDSFSVWMHVDFGGDLTDTVSSGRIYNETGAYEDVECSTQGDPDSMTGTNHKTLLNMPRGVWESRIWHSLKDSAVLNDLANPNSSAYEQSLVGDEEAVWYLETIPEQTMEEGSTSSLFIDVNQTSNNRTLQVLVYGLDNNLTPISLQTPPIVSLSKDDDVSLTWWNNTADYFEKNVTIYQTERKSSSSYVWVYEFTDVPSGNYVVSANADIRLEDGKVVNATAHENVKVESMIEIAGLGASQLIEIAVWAGIMLWTLEKGMIGTPIIASLPMFGPMFRNAGVSYPVNFIAGILIVTLFYWLEHWSAWFEETKIGN